MDRQEPVPIGISPATFCLLGIIFPEIWFSILRNVCYDAFRAKESEHDIISLDEETAAEVPDSKPGPNVLAVQNSTKLRIREAVEALPLEFKTVIILREFDGLSYKEISDIAGVPVGTVMSRLSRARHQLAILLQKEGENE